MLCQTCKSNVALIKARIENATVHICIPCALALINDDKDIQLEPERSPDVQAKEANQMEAPDKGRTRV